MSNQHFTSQSKTITSANLPIRMELPSHFLDEENRVGALVPSELKKIWAIELDLLDTFLNLCKNHDIHVQVFAGTLLGAVRHRGFIPWDDDIDICMDRENFEKLLQIPESEISYPYFLQTAFSDRRFFCPYARFRNSETTALIAGQTDRDYNCGIYIDVFVLDGLAQSKRAQRMQRLILELIQMVISVLPPEAPPPKTLVTKSFRMLRPFFRIIGANRLFRLHKLVVSWFNKKVDRFSLITHGGVFTEKYWMYKNDLVETTMIPFENLSVPATANYDKVLSRIYGDYMTPPPESERGKWHEGLIFFDPNTPYKKHFEQMEKQ